MPARELFSIRLGETADEDISTWRYCWAEFFLSGYGWVTVDPRDVGKAMLVENLELGSDKTRAYREFFWGGAEILLAFFSGHLIEAFGPLGSECLSLFLSGIVHRSPELAELLSGHCLIIGTHSLTSQDQKHQG